MSSERSTAVKALWSGLHVFERYTLAATVLSVVYLRSMGFRVDWSTIQYTVWPFVRMAPKLLALGVATQLVFQLLRAARKSNRLRDARAYLRSVLRWRWLWLWLRLFAAYAVTTYVYFWVKVTIPLVNTRLFDPLLERLDRLLHFGLSPTVFIVELTRSSPTLLWLFDTWYGLWITSVMVVVAFYSTASDPRLRRSFMLSCCLLWTLGTYFYLAMPSLGPAFAFPETTAPVLDQLTSARGGHQVLWQNYEKMLAGREGPLYSFNPTRGIAAMPSLHVAAHVLFLLWVRSTLRPLLVLFGLGTALTFVGSIITGWHYAVDGYVGAVLAVFVYWLARRLEPVPPQALLSPPGFQRGSAEQNLQPEEIPAVPPRQR